ncbi:MAG: hypothetical protein EP343_31000 [Deltaproteobacteria bacterium]|nr:MAG: hypothetical protein EP343_31000 [Deltaproteobacteria bacterium]
MTLTDTTRRKIVIIGGGVGGMAVFTKIHQVLRYPNVTLIEPSTHCQYPPLWPLVGVGAADPDETSRPIRDYLPETSRWARDRAKKIDEKKHRVITESGREIPYEFLVVCPSLEYNPKDIKKLDEMIEAGQVHTTLDLDSAKRTREALEEVTEGTILVTTNAMGIRDNTSLMMAQLIADLLKRRGVRDKVKIVFSTVNEQLFPNDDVHKAYERLAKDNQIEIMTGQKLVGIDPETKEAEFAPLDEKGKPSKETTKVSYNFLHFTPELVPPEVVSKSKLVARRGDFKGWLNVDPHTLQQTKTDNVFGLGDVTNLPIPMSMDALEAQAEVVANNLLARLRGRGPYFFKTYDGSASLPFMHSRGGVMQTRIQYHTTEDDKGNQEVDGFSVTQAPSAGALLWLTLRYLAPRRYWKRHLKRI